MVFLVLMVVVAKDRRGVEQSNLPVLSPS